MYFSKWLNKQARWRHACVSSEMSWMTAERQYPSFKGIFCFALSYPLRTRGSQNKRMLAYATKTQLSADRHSIPCSVNYISRDIAILQPSAMINCQLIHSSQNILCIGGKIMYRIWNHQLLLCAFNFFLEKSLNGNVHVCCFLWENNIVDIAILTCLAV